MDRVARITGVLFNPIFMPVYGLVIIFTAPTVLWYIPFRAKQILFFILLINNVLIPLSLIPFFRYRIRTVTSGPDQPKESMTPLIVQSLLCIVTSYIFFKLQIPLFLKAYSYSFTILAVTLTLITLRWSISLHSAGAGFLTATVLILSVRMSSGLPWLLAGVVVISGLILTSRLKLSLNRPAEVYAGYLAGLLLPAASMLLLQ